MSAAETLFQIPAGDGPAAVSSCAPSGLAARWDDERPVRWRLLDSFDRRLLRAGELMEVVESAGELRVRWRGLAGGPVLLDAPVDGVPRVPGDLSSPRARARLAERLEVRALMEVGRTHGRVSQGALRDGEGKTVVRLELWRRDRSAVGRLLVLPLRGYEREARALLRGLSTAPGVLELPEGVPVPLPLRRSPWRGAPPGKAVRLDPGLRTDEACKIVLARYQAIYRANLEGLRSDVDPEFLHDLRVAVRRTRSFITQMKSVFPAARMRRFRREFAWLGQATGPARDADVHLLDLERFTEMLPRRLHDGLEPLEALLVEHKQAVRGLLLGDLDSARFHRMDRDWQAFLEAPVPARSRIPNAMRPVARSASERIRRVHRRSLREGGAIEARSAPERLHELRKTCKKLRYLLDAFQSLYPAPDVVPVLERLRGLQDNLGRYNDLQVQQAALSGFRAELRARDAVGPHTEEAVALLVGRMHGDEQQVRREFARCFAEYAARQARRDFKTLLRGAVAVP